MSKTPYRFWVGVDLIPWLHEASVLGVHGEFLGELGFPPTVDSLREFVDWLLALAKSKPNRIAVALSSSCGPVVHFLLKHQINVYALDPLQVDLVHALRCAQDDHRGAFVLAEALRTNLHRFHPLRIRTTVILASQHRSCPPSDRSTPHTPARRRRSPEGVP